MKFTETTLFNALSIATPEFVESAMAAEIVPIYVKQLNGLSRISSRSPAAEETMTMRYIDCGELLVLQTLGRRIELEIKKERTAISAQIRDCFDDRSGPAPGP